MSHIENDRIWDAVVDKSLGDERPEITYEWLMSLSLEGAFEYLAYGKLPKAVAND